MAASDLGAVAFAEFLRKATAVTKGTVYNCMSSSELQTLQKSFTAAGGHWSTFVIWAKATCSKNAEICPSILGRPLFRNNHPWPPERGHLGG
jgi:hypothetical protein